MDSEGNSQVQNFPPANDSNAALNISVEILGAINNLNKSLNTNMGGVRKGLEGLTSSMNDNFVSLAQRLNSPRAEESEEESSDRSSSEEEDQEDHREVVDH